MFDLSAADCRLSFSCYLIRAGMAIIDVIRAGPVASTDAEDADCRTTGLIGELVTTLFRKRYCVSTVTLRGIIEWSDRK